MQSLFIILNSIFDSVAMKKNGSHNGTIEISALLNYSQAIHSIIFTDNIRKFLCCNSFSFRIVF